MVKIRYSELPAGLHVIAEADSRGTVVYLLPGLTPAQRRAALARARSSGRMGQGPALPALSMVAAIGADRVRTATRTSAAAMRRHPMLLLPPLAVLVSGALVVTLMSFATVTSGPPGKAAPGQLPTLGINGGQPGSGGHGHSSARPGHHRRGPAGPGRPHHHLRSPGSAAAQAPYSPAPTSTPSPTAGSRAPSPSPSPSPSSGGTCLKLGPLGLCVKV
jgi:hypothetical protein